MIPWLEWWISSSLLHAHSEVPGALWHLWHSTRRAHELSLSSGWSEGLRLYGFSLSSQVTGSCLWGPREVAALRTDQFSVSMKPLRTWNMKTYMLHAILSFSLLSPCRMQLETEEAEGRGDKTHWPILSFPTLPYLTFLLPDSLQIVALLMLQVHLNIQTMLPHSDL